MSTNDFNGPAQDGFKLSLFASKLIFGQGDLQELRALPEADKRYVADRLETSLIQTIRALGEDRSANEKSGKDSIILPSLLQVDGANALSLLRAVAEIKGKDADVLIKHAAFGAAQMKTGDGSSYEENILPVLERAYFADAALRFLDAGIAAQDAADIAENLHPGIIFQLQLQEADPVLEKALEKFRALPAELKRDVADRMELKLVEQIKMAGAQEQKQPTRALVQQSPKLIDAWEQTHTNAMIAGELALLREIAAVKGDAAAPLLKATVAETAGLPGNDRMFVALFNEALVRAIAPQGPKNAPKKGNQPQP